MVVLDTATLIDVARKKPAAVGAVNEALASGESLLVSAASVFELSSGRPAGLDAKQKVMLDECRMVAVDRPLAEKAGSILSKLIASGLEIDPFDCIIAATALENDERVLTANVKHFSRVPGLAVQGY